jgi:putative hemolysin
MDLVPCEAINAKTAFLRMPPLIKGYLRLGARIGDGCVIDREFETVDVFITLPVKEIRQRYINYYSGDSGLAA